MTEERRYGGYDESEQRMSRMPAAVKARLGVGDHIPAPSQTITPRQARQLINMVEEARQIGKRRPSLDAVRARVAARSKTDADQKRRAALARARARITVARVQERQAVEATRAHSPQQHGVKLVPYDQNRGR